MTIQKTQLEHIVGIFQTYLLATDESDFILRILSSEDIRIPK